MNTQFTEIMANLHNAQSSSVQFTWINGSMPINIFILRLFLFLPGKKTKKYTNIRIAPVNTTPTDSSTVPLGDHWITVAPCSVLNVWYKLL